MYAVLLPLSHHAGLVAEAAKELNIMASIDKHVNDTLADDKLLEALLKLARSSPSRNLVAKLSSYDDNLRVAGLSFVGYNCTMEVAFKFNERYQSISKQIAQYR